MCAGPARMCGVRIGFARMRKVRLGLARICEMCAEPARGKTDNLLIQIHGRSTHE